jgi:hypothetical protein
VRIGIVGNGADKFTPLGEERARHIIRCLLWMPGDTLVSGHSPLGGIDIWAEEEALAIGCPLDIKAPDVQQWDPPGGYGYKARNLDIANTSDLCAVILADVYPAEYTGRRWDVCYHHRGHGIESVTPTNHVKSGGCWTGRKSANAYWYIVNNY